MITVDEALSHLFSLADPQGTECVPLAKSVGRVLATAAKATRNQPPFSASAMDGYAVAGTAEKGAQYNVIGESAAGTGYNDSVRSGQAIRIFTGAPVPEGCDTVVIQEDVTCIGDQITVTGDHRGSNIRPAGGDFKIGQTLTTPRLLSANDIALLASMNIPTIEVFRKPDVALISTGNELVMPGETPGPDQIIASNTFGLKALLESHGAKVRILPIARDNVASLEQVFDLAADADLIVTIGGASVGDHDLVGKVAQQKGMEQSFYKIAMRPGKPLMAGRMGDAMMVGLPGNPVSAMVCGHVFLIPVIQAMLGLGNNKRQSLSAVLANSIGANGPREHYMRAVVQNGQLTVFEKQDSSLLTVLADANALLIRPVNGVALTAGAQIQYLPI
ncbi:MAG: molybdopterin molybdotransferase MoeA [Paracoccaceae bacterium]|nr:molybdopterin molybdotransferase MoeA [Paracoccaceae bacterium]MDG2259344.1 molybdopterin molybdotransferase MoeA [Paracoccaceae bacterium]